MVRVERHRRWRRIAFAIALAVAAVVALIAPASSVTTAGPEFIGGALILMTLCSLAWIETESGRPRSGLG
jgi:peptidoglycan/LPS O-acetylase OafA/YrhL